MPVLLLSAAVILMPAANDDLALMVGLRNAMAVAIRDYGYRCPEVLDYVPLEFVDGGRVLKVSCGSSSEPPSRPPRTFRLLAYPDGDFTVSPWREGSADLR